jgi:hypothetical protein
MMTGIVYVDFGETITKRRYFFLAPAGREGKNAGMISTKKR